MKTIRLYLLLICLCWSLIGCGILKSENLTGNRIEPAPSTPIVKPVAFNNPAGKLSEVAPPEVIQELARNSDRSPKIEFIAPQSDRIFSDAQVEVKLELKDLSLFRDNILGLGPHLNLILDDLPARQIYDIEEPIILENLAPGTHTLRAFAVLPWNESYKNPEAFARTTFHILTKTNNNNPDPNRPLLTYNSPEGIYGAEPILLDFYLSNAPLHVIARENPNDEIEDWRIRVTINGESFIVEDWQPMYLTGFEKGNNWVQIELLDEEGNNLENAFNNTVRLVTYQPQTQSNLDRLVTGQISVSEAQRVLEPSREVEILPEETPETIEPEIEPEPALAPQEIPPNEAEEQEESQETEALGDRETSNATEIIEIEPETDNVEIIEIEENLKLDTPQTEIKPSPTDTIKPDDLEQTTEFLETDSNVTSIEIIETEDNLETEKPIAEIKIPNNTSVEIAESESETASEPKSKTPRWLKNLWGNLRQKFESVIRRI